MKKITIIFFILILIIITSIYTIFNIYIRLENKKEKKEDINSKEKITSTDLRIGITNFDNINPILSENINVQNNAQFFSNLKTQMIIGWRNVLQQNGIK